MINNDWPTFRKLFARFFDVPESVVDSIAVYEIVELCLFGKSNTEISSKLDIPIECVEKILVERIDFIGFIEDLDFSPVVVYEKYKDFDAFCGVLYYYGFMLDSVTEKLFVGCKELQKMKKEIDKFYAKQ
jgi:hypothetical protein